MAVDLVIKIPEKVYNALMHTEFDANLVVNEMRKAISNGIPLPKGHGRLIDECTVMQMIDDAKVKYDNSKTFAENIIRFAPTVIEADKEQEDDNT